MSDSQVLSGELCVAYRNTGGFCPWGNLCMFYHPGGGSSSNARPFTPAAAPIPSQTAVQRAPPQHRQIEPAPNPPQSSGTSNQRAKPKKNKKQKEKREEKGGSEPLPANTSTGEESSNKQNKKNRKITILSADGRQTWTLNLTFLTAKSKNLETMFENTVIDLQGLVRYRGLNTFKLDGVEAGDFSLFLSALRAGSEFNFSFDDLKTILALASDWGFSKLRNRCMKSIKKLRPPPVDQVILARRSQVPQWVREAYLMLAVRTPRLTTGDAQALGTQATAIIARAREEILLHRLQAITLVDGSTRNLPCQSPSRPCREVLCEARLSLMAENRSLPKTNKARSNLFAKEVSHLGQELCNACRSEEALGCIIRALDEEINVAKKVFEEELGADDSRMPRDRVKGPM